MLKIKVTAAVLGACYIQCNICIHALQLQTRPPVPKSPRRGHATARRYLNDSHPHFDIGSSAAVPAERRERRAAGASHGARRTRPAAPSSELLTFDEEKEIASEIRRFRSVTTARDNLADWLAREAAPHRGAPSERQWASSCSLSVDELQEVLARGQEARTRLITGNVGLVTMIAKRYYQMVRGGAGRSASAGNGGSLKLDDLIQEGNLGIMEAAERFDPTRGFRFSTYATHWIRQRIVRSIAESSRTIRLPVHVQTMVRHMRKKNTEVTARIGRLPSLPELAHEMGVPLDKVRLYQHATRNVLSLELPADRHSTEDTRTLGDRVACDEVATPEEDFMSEAMRGEVHQLLDALGGAERGVLTHRFGLEAGTPKTLQETATIMGVSIDKVRTTEAKALNKLRRPQTNYRLKEYLGGAAEAVGDHSEYAELRPPLHQHTAATTAGGPQYPHQTHAAGWDGHDAARDRYTREPKRRTPESIWSF